jgi:hypothetical protein
MPAGATTSHMQVKVDCGLSWEVALQTRDELLEEEAQRPGGLGDAASVNGFYK